MLVYKQHRTISSLALLLIWYQTSFSENSVAEVLQETDSELVNQYNNNYDNNTDYKPKRPAKLTINNIFVKGNTLVNRNAILTKAALRVGDVFRKKKTEQTINAIDSLGYFRNVKIYTKQLSPKKVNIYIVVEEKDKIDKIVYEGNYHLREKEIEKNLELSKLKTIEPEELITLTEELKKLYARKDYHHVTIDAQLEPTGEKQVIVKFIITEGPKSAVKRVFFKGNAHIPSRKLRTLIFTREDWILGFYDKAGSFQRDALDYDKHVIENYYQSNGYLTAFVSDIKVEEDPNQTDIIVTFNIDEGDLYTIEDISIPGNDILNEEELLARIPIKPGQLYSKEKIRTTMEALRQLWGEFGYINADVQPDVVPNQETRTVSLKFVSDIGNRVTVNRINIVGNKKTRDKVIRRQIRFNEGDLLTSSRMEESKNSIEGLGYFDQKSGVNWKINRIDDDIADLDLMLKEVKTGKMWAQVGFGGLDDIRSPSESAKISGGFQDINFLGTGIQYNVNGIYSTQDRVLMASVLNPWILDRPISGGIDVMHRTSIYEEFRNVMPTSPTERITGVGLKFGFVWPWLNFTNVLFEGGFEKIRYLAPIIASSAVPADVRENFQGVINNHFIPGNLAWVAGTLAKDTRNHPTFPTRGYTAFLSTKVGLPIHLCGNFGYAKFDADFKYYTPLIEEYNLVFYFHAHLGLIGTINNQQVPYRELYHIGGIGSVRGFFFGQLGPQALLQTGQFEVADSIGGKKSFWFNAELQFPITSDFSMRGVVFYDGGAGWDTTHANTISPKILANNNFNFRQSVGIGVRLTYPTPVRIDWGFKLDRNKRRGEAASEVHFTALHDF